MTDADLDAIVAGRPDAIVFPKAEGATSVVHLDAKLTTREAIAACPRDKSGFSRKRWKRLRAFSPRERFVPPANG